VFRKGADVNAGYAILLGIVQGLTEFLPVSSSAHLVIAQSLLHGFRQPGILFDTVLHVGTLCAVIFFLRNTIYSLVMALLPATVQQTAPDTAASVSVRRKIILNIVIATIITGIIGLSFKNEVEKLFASVAVSASLLIITGVLLFAAGRITKNGRGDGDITVCDSIIIGIAQGLAIMPGISRSGATMAFGIFRGLTGETAARFSFLLSIPAVMGAVILESRHVSLLSLPDIEAYFMGFAAAAITGFLSLKLLFLMIKKWSLTIFAYYCWFVGFSVLLLILASGR
jgi:undecaprenyl-diphosphatase